MYDLDRRPPGPIEYSLGPIPKEKAAKTNAYFQSMLGAEYEKIGHVHQAGLQDSDFRPPWVAIGNDYAGFVQSGTIMPKIGRAVSVNPDPTTKLATVRIEAEDRKSTILENVASIVMATGFAPFDSLSFLPRDVLSILEYTTEDSFLPLVLDQGGSLRSEIPDLGFVGYYRGPYWGVMEMQARFLGKAWAQANYKPPTAESQMQNIRLLRQPATRVQRGQFPMGDYVGLMETFSKDLGIKRTELQGIEGSGPVFPARYIHDDMPSSSTDQNQVTKSSDVESTLKSFLGNCGADVLNRPEAQTAAAMAIFRALHGRWACTKRGFIGEMAGTVTFYPRYPTDPAYDREYVREDLESESTDSSAGPMRTIWRLSEAGGTASPIRIYPIETSVNASEKQVPRCLNLLSARHGKSDNVDLNSTTDVTGAHPPDYIFQDDRCHYSFWFDGVSISRWELSRVEDQADLDRSTTRTVYTRI